MNGVERAQEPIESKLDRAVFEKLTFSQAVYACRAVSEALPAKTLREIQALWPKVADLACQPSASLFDGRSKSRWIAEIRRQLTYLLEIRAMTLAPPFGLGRSISPGCLEKSWAIPAAENLNSAERVSSAIEVQAPEPIEQVAKNIPGVKTVDCVQEPIEIQRQEPIELTSENIPGVDRVQEPIESSIPTPTFGALCDRPALGLQEVIDLLEARGFDSLAVGDRVEMGGKPFVKSRTIVRTSEDTFTFFWEGTEPESALADINATENSNGVKSVTCAIEQAIEPSKFGRIVYPKPIAPTTENSNGVEIDRPWTDADRWNPADFGEVLHAAEASGQLNLLEWDVSEPPDSDDYDLITDFHAAYDLWLVREQVKEVFEKSDENNCEKAGRVSTEPAGADEIAIGTGLPSECDNRAQLHGTGGHNQDEGL
ncbi:MAG: hypothetical protein JGK26_32500, partial [Microcoleus sp. PH2017_27_LUM_O_A]|uniref:hypothetical protein n=1 Tax=Microcoleus sp. PH2017_27_LUM_O_A TaxID=2798837 RepID=UPI001D741738